MSEHSSMRPRLALAAAGALEPAEALRVERHAATCPECRRELETWRVYAQGLRQLPQPVLPADLSERTRALVLEPLRARERPVAAGQSRNAPVLAALALLGWASGLALWILARIFTGGSAAVLGANLVSGVTWFVLSTVVAWMSATAAVVMLGRRRGIRRAI